MFKLSVDFLPSVFPVARRITARRLTRTNVMFTLLIGKELQVEVKWTRSRAPVHVCFLRGSILVWVIGRLLLMVLGVEHDDSFVAFGRHYSAPFKAALLEPTRRAGYWPAIPRSPIPKVPHYQGPIARAVFEGVGELNPPVQSLDPQKTFYNVLRGSILIPPITPLTLLIMSKTTRDRNFSPESRLQQSLQPAPQIQPWR